MNPSFIRKKSKNRICVICGVGYLNATKSNESLNLQRRLLSLLVGLTKGGKRDVNFDKVKNSFGPSTQLSEALKTLKGRGYIESHAKKYSITKEGMHYLDLIIRSEMEGYWEKLRGNVLLNEFRLKIPKNEEDIGDLLQQERKIGKGPEWDDLFLCARKWNSYTPALHFQSEASERAVGGGYLLIWNGRGIAIDPGYDFMKILSEDPIFLGINDIDAIVLTHDHPDHTAGVDEMLTLIHELHEKDNQHTIDFYGNLGALYKFGNQIQGLSECLNIQPLTPGTSVDLKEKYGLTMHVKRAFHREVWSGKNYAVGLVFELENSKSQKPFKVGITSDTAWDLDLVAEYAGADILIEHVGSLETVDKPLSNHLGSVGCYLLLKYVCPQLAVVSEFGEEMDNKRVGLVEFLHKLTQTKVVPADIGLKIKLPGCEIYCSDCKQYHPVEMINTREFRGAISYKHKKNKK